MGMKEIITGKVPTVQVGDILCGTTWNKNDVTGTDWFPTSLKVTSVTQTHLETPTQNATWWLVTERQEGQYVNELGPFGVDCELHVVKA